MAFGSGFRSTDRAEPCKKRSHRCKAVELHNLLAIRFALNELRKYLKNKQREISKANELLDKFRGLNLRQKSLIYHSIQHPDNIYTIEAHKNTHGIAYDTARKDLIALAIKGFFEIEKEGKRLLLFLPTGKAIEKLRNK
ncbi:MAG: hypothetical protein A2Z72_06015 [Omnitrophica bacterium RBG_13_46_9]|nr:MAG: hypothetical protein A2Z72_06015 [Omnitrophica bacterium RBG_13_46_9]